MTLKQTKNLELLDLDNKIIEIKKKLFELRFKQATRQSIKTHLFKKHKRMLAQLLTTKTNLNTYNKLYHD